jgi:hypothetical protein
MKNVNKNLTFHQRIDIGWQPILTQLRKTTGNSIKGLVEDALSNTYGINEKGKTYEINT